jgi:hypothetical protein
MREEVRDAGRRVLHFEAKSFELPRSRGGPATFAAKFLHEANVMAGSSDIP